jgi:anti-sigma factor RsiW
VYSELGDKDKPTPSLQATLAGIRRWNERLRNVDPGAELVKGRVAEAIAGYLGQDGAQQVLKPVTERSKLFPAVEPVLSIFLGRRAATRLIRHVIEAAIVRI